MYSASIISFMQKLCPTFLCEDKCRKWDATEKKKSKQIKRKQWAKWVMNVMTHEESGRGESLQRRERDAWLLASFVPGSVALGWTAWWAHESQAVYLEKKAAKRVRVRRTMKARMEKREEWKHSSSEIDDGKTGSEERWKINQREHRVQEENTELTSMWWRVIQTDGMGRRKRRN